MLPTNANFPSFLQHEHQGPVAAGSLPWEMAAAFLLPARLWSQVLLKPIAEEQKGDWGSFANS